MSSTDELFQQVKSYLLTADSEGRSAYDHLEKILLNILDENSNDIANHPEKLSELSSLIKKHAFQYGASSLASNEAAQLNSARLQQLLANKELFNKPAPEVVTTIEQPTPFTTVTTTTVKPPVAPTFSSVVRDNAYWRHCGVGLHEQEAFLLEQSISRLAMSRKLEEVRFFGKIFGTKANYLVVTSKRYVGDNEKVYQEVNTMPKPPRKKVDVDVQLEPGFKGLNRVSFWVASNPASQWVLLPDVTPQQINASRRVKKLFTGDLAAPVICSPAFDGNEAVYLRAQLSRIFSSTYITPTGALEKVEPEDDEAVEEDEEEGKKKGPKEAKYFAATRISKEYAPDEEAGVHALLDLEQWVHSEPHIFETGRQTKVPEKPEVEGEDEEPKDEEEEEEAAEEEERKEEEEKELFLPVKKDYLYAVIDIPKEPSPEDGEDEAAEEEAGEEDGEQQEEEENKPLDDEEIPDDDPLKKKVAAWTAKAVNTTYKKHSVVTVKSLRWPGAVAFAANGAKAFGAVYFGNGLKKTDHAFTPIPAPQIQKEAPDITEVMDATAATEKLVLRGEEPKENDSEDEKEEEEPEEEA
jgi:radial spoke head protein 4/6